MKRWHLILALAVAIGLVGCEKISKPYIMTVDRVDQKVEGNRGYLKGTPPPEQERTSLKRPLIAVDMDFVEIKGKPAQDTAIVTKQGNKPIFPKASENAEEQNIK